MEQVISLLYLSILPIVLLAFIVSILAAAFRFFVLPQLKGRMGEARINFMAKQWLDPSVYYLIPNIILPTPDGTTQIDHVIVSRYGIFVIETKNYKGWIYGGENEPQWTQVIFRRKEQFQNPLRQNYKHTKTLSALTGIPEICFKSLVVFVGDCAFKSEMPANVIYIRGFIEYIRSHQTPVIKDEQVTEIVSAIQKSASTVTDAQKVRHAAHVRENRQPVSADSPTPSCPRCGAHMVLRTSRRDNSRFWGCPKYPACHGIRQAQ